MNGYLGFNAIFLATRDARSCLYLGILLLCGHCAFMVSNNNNKSNNNISNFAFVLFLNTIMLEGIEIGQ